MIPRKNDGFNSEQGAAMKQLNVLIAVSFSLLLTGAASAESIWVQSDNVELRSGKGAVYPVVANAPKGTELTVMSRDGKWVQVQAGTNQGWVYETAVSSQKVDAGFSGIKPGIVKMDTSSASKGAPTIPPSNTPPEKT